MVLVPGGSFILGSDVAEDEGPQREAILSDFFIDRHEVTVGEYRAVRTHFTLPGRDNMPVKNVLWHDADAYCRALGKRLPTEAEWEKACRGRDGNLFPWGNEFVESALNSAEGGLGAPAEVGSYPSGASPYGALDMSGNVWEWTADWYAPYAGSSFTSEDTGEKYRVIRGGAWNIAGRVSRCTNRFTSDPSLDGQDIGFRCVRSR
jgi:iron(II)-dependent oxidoreductase